MCVCDVWVLFVVIIERDTLDLIYYMFYWAQGGGTKEGMRWRGNDVSVMFWKVRTFYSNWKKNGSTMN